MKSLTGAKMPRRTRAQAWTEYERWAKEKGWLPHVLAIALERARIAFELDEPPWCWEEYLDDGATPFAPESMVREAIAEVIAQLGRPVGEPLLWPEVRKKITSRGFRVRKKTVLTLAPKAKPGRPKISRNS